MADLRTADLRVIDAADVGPDQPRWWTDHPASSLAYLRDPPNPDDPPRLHLYPHPSANEKRWAIVEHVADGRAKNKEG